jgi:hypothetical protein
MMFLNMSIAKPDKSRQVEIYTHFGISPRFHGRMKAEDLGRNDFVAKFHKEYSGEVFRSQ